MKKVTLLTVIVLSLTFSLRAQLTKNSWMLGGDLGFTSTGSSPAPNLNTTVNHFVLAPKAGYFFLNRLAVGLSVTGDLFHYHYSSQGTDVTSHENLYGFGPFIRYYFLPAQRTANILVEANYQYNTSSISNATSLTTHSNGFGFAAGPAFFLNTTVALEWTIGYSWRNGIGHNDFINTHSFLTTIGLKVYLHGQRIKG